MLGPLVSIILKVFDIIRDWVGNKSKLQIEISNLHYQLIRGNDLVRVISPYLSRYYAKVNFANVGRRNTMIKNISLKIADQSLSPANFKFLSLESGAVQEQTLIFPVEEKMAKKEDTFKLTVTDTFGKKIKVKGSYPIR